MLDFIDGLILFRICHTLFQKTVLDFLTDADGAAEILKVAGIAVTKVDTRKNYFKQTMETLHELEEIYVFDSFIRVDSSVEWALAARLMLSLPTDTSHYLLCQLL